MLQPSIVGPWAVILMRITCQPAPQEAASRGKVAEIGFAIRVKLWAAGGGFLMEHCGEAFLSPIANA